MSELCITTFLQELESGKVRAASPTQEGTWKNHPEVKEKILTLFRSSQVQIIEEYYLDKAPLVPRKFTLSDDVRIVPFGSCVRSGAYVAQGVVIMPPSYINIGAYIGKNTMLDSHVLVGSCAQIGECVHLSAGVTIGGVLEPIEALPVIIENNVFVGSGCVVTSGFHIKKGAVLGAGLSLSRSIPVYDTVHHEIYYGHIPEYAVVVPGSRSITSTFSQTQLALQCGVIVKYRDERTNTNVALEDALR